MIEGKKATKSRRSDDPFLEYQPRTVKVKRVNPIRLIRMWKYVYNMDVVKVDFGYKGGRNLPYVLYNVYDNTGKLVFEHKPAHILYEPVKEAYDNPEYR